MLVEEKVLNYNNFIHLGKININEAKKIGKGAIENITDFLDNPLTKAAAKKMGGEVLKKLLTIK